MELLLVVACTLSREMRERGNGGERENRALQLGERGRTITGDEATGDREEVLRETKVWSSVVRVFSRGAPANSTARHPCFLQMLRVFFLCYLLNFQYYFILFPSA